jgi:hypothetical protein
MAKNKQNSGNQQAEVNHSESQHGDKTLSRAAEISQTSDADRKATGPRHDPEQIRSHSDEGKDRLFEDREQHDEAEKNSEKTRLARDIDRHGHAPDTELDHRNVQSSAKRKN